MKSGTELIFILIFNEVSLPQVRLANGTKRNDITVGHNDI